MVETKLEDEVIEIFKYIDAGENFLLSGGAGSGKTYSLVSVINEIEKHEPNSSIACITYTNAAVHEIEHRVSGNNLFVSTIHDFLWENISSFQNELKTIILKLINDPDTKINSPTGEIPYANDFEDGITYKEHLKIGKGEISHDEVILVAYYMFQEYVKLSDILKDRYDYILVDEYQDTSPYVVKILLDELSKSKKKNIIGFFGDSMQAIYDDGVGDLNHYIKNGSVKEVRKQQNRRNPESVMNLSNKIRVDGLEQVPSSDNNAPNMENGTVKSGDIKFIYSKVFDMGHIKSLDIFNKWDFKDSKETKELRLTHNLIADEAGFASLMNIYDTDPIIKFKSEFNKFIKKNDIKINENDTFDNVIDSVPSWIYSNRAKVVDNRGKTYKEVLLQNMESEKLYEYIKEWPYLKVKRMYFDKDNLISDKKEIDEEKSTQSKRDRLIRHLFKIQEVKILYETKMYNDFLRKTSYKITRNSDKIEIKAKVDKLVEMKGNTIEEVIEFANNSGLCIKDDKINNFINEEDYLYWRVKQIPYSEFEKLYSYLEGYVPLSTQHKIKGNEFHNVLVLLDSGGWTKYNFNYLFNPEFGQTLKPKERESFERVLLRTEKLFYVCCTRAKENLVVFFQEPSDEVKAKATEWFGKDNIIDIDAYKKNEN